MERKTLISLIGGGMIGLGVINFIAKNDAIINVKKNSSIVSAANIIKPGSYKKNGTIINLTKNNVSIETEEFQYFARENGEEMLELIINPIKNFNNCLTIRYNSFHWHKDGQIDHIEILNYGNKLGRIGLGRQYTKENGTGYNDCKLIYVINDEKRIEVNVGSDYKEWFENGENILAEKRKQFSGYIPFEEIRHRMNLEEEVLPR